MAFQKTIFRGKKIWSEDECTRGTQGHETITKACKRFFGRPITEEDPIFTEDWGDAVAKLYGQGICIVHSFDGYSIYTMSQLGYEHNRKIS